MEFLLCLMLAISSAAEARYRFQIIQEKITVDYVNKNCLDFEAEVFKFNETANAVNFTVTPRIDFHPNGRISVRGFKSLNNKYQLPLFRFDTTLKQGAQMESFDILALRMDYSRPPLIWPLQIGVSYRVTGWNPDSTKFLPNIPGGKWMFKIYGLFPNKTKVMEAAWFFSIA